MRRGFAFLLVFVLLLPSACSGSTAESSSATPASRTVAASDRVLISGTAECNFTGGMTEKQVGPVTVYTGPMACTEETSDPRVSGLDEFELTETVFLGGGNDIAWFRCDDQTLTTEGGIWRGACFGSEFTNPDDEGLYTSGHATFIGEGAYEGLVYEQLYTQSPDTDDRYLVAGWIEPAAP